MKKVVLNGRIVSVIVLIMGILGLFLYTKIDSFSMASTNSEIITELSLEKFINYSEEWGSGTLLHYNVKSGIKYDDEEQKSPIQKLNIKIKSPQINGSYPESIVVATKSTKATNADSVDNVKYAYDKDSGTIIISASNIDENGNPISESINDNEKDEFEVISNYGKNVYNNENTETPLDVNISTQYTLYSSENNVVESSKEFKATVNKNIGDMLSAENTTDEIYNGYMKSNAINGTDYITSFTEETELQVENKNAQDTITLQETSENSVYKVLAVNYDDMKAVLGEEGYIEIYDTENNLLATLNKEKTSTAFENDINQIVIKTSNIIKEGIIRISSIKEIKNNVGIINNVNVISKISGIKDDNITYEKEKNNYSEVKDSQTEVEVNLSQTEWTNQKQNEITFNIDLNSNDIKYNLFKNPQIKIVLPKEVEKVILGESTIIYGNGLELKNVTAETNENGNYEILATVDGTQTEYIENELGLVTELRIPAIIILKNDIESKTTDIKIATINEYGSVSTIEDTVSLELINFKEDIIANEIEKGKVETLLQNATSGEPTEETTNENLKIKVAPMVGKNLLENTGTVYEGEFIKYNIEVTNTSEENMENVKVVATIPDGTTYCELEAGYELNNSKYEYQYKTETKEKEITIGTLTAGQSYNGFFEVKVNDLENTNEQKETNMSIQTYIGGQQGQKYENSFIIKDAEYQVYMTAKRYSSSDETWYYELYLDSDNDNDVEVKLYFPEEFEVEYETWLDVQSEEPEGIDQNTVKDEYGVITATLSNKYRYIFQGEMHLKEEEKKSTGEPIEKLAYAEAISNGNVYASNEVRTMIQYECINITMSSENEGANVNAYDEINYEIEINNIGGFKKIDYSTEDEEIAIFQQVSILDITLDDLLPEEVSPDTVTYTNWVEVSEVKDNGVKEVYNYVKKDNIIETITTNAYDENENKLPNLSLHLIIPKGESITINVKTTARALDKDTTITNKATAYGEKIATIETNTVSHTILANKENDEIFYHLPEDAENTENTDNQNNQNSENNSDSPNNNNNNQNNNTDNKTIKYDISGGVWLDENSDGERQNDEPLLKNIKVSLINMQNSSIIAKTATTDNNGKYIFEDLEQGNYIVMFKYDINSYKLTEYKKSGVDNSVNSDAANQEITINGERLKVGLTDTLNLNSSISNIDLGLIEVKPCDFKVEKYVSKVTVKTGAKTKEKTYNDSSLAKVEIKRKEIEGAIVVVEYKIVVTNVGESAGKIEEIIDTLPKELTYLSSSNSSWVKFNNGTLTNTSLYNQTLGVGEKIEFKVNATKTMTENSTGTFTNKVEITKAQSLENVADNNSSNNSANADLIVSISTGAVMYIFTIFIILIILLAIGIVLYNKWTMDIRKLQGPNYISFMIIFLVVMAFSGATAPKSNAAENSDGNVVWRITDNTTPKKKNTYTKKLPSEYDNAYFVFWDNDGAGYTRFVGSLYTTNSSGKTWYNNSGLSKTEYNRFNRHRAFNEQWSGTKYDTLDSSRRIKGKCMQAGLNAAGHHSYDFEYGDYGGLDTVVKYSKINTTWGKERESKGDKYYLKLEPQEGTTRNNINIDNFDATHNILGPFEFICYSYKNNDENQAYQVTPNYSATVKNGQGQSVSATICDSRGRTKSLGATSKDTKTFYLKVAKSDCNKGIGEVTLSVDYTFEEITYYYATGTPEYGTGNDSEQTVKLLNPPEVPTGDQPYNHKFDNSITWKGFNSIVEVIKVDKDNHSIVLPGTEIRITKQGSTNTQYTTTTGSDGKATFYNISPGSYTIEETKLPDIYAYLKVAERKINNDVGNGAHIQFIYENEKQTGTLRILKEDSSWIIDDSEENSSQRTIDDTKYKKLEGIQFKLKKDGKYVRLNNVDQMVGTAKTGGRNIVESMDYFDDVNQGTTLITDVNGNIKINNILVGNYEIEEYSVGDNHYGYALNDDKTTIDGDYVYYQTGECTGTNASDFNYVMGTKTKLGNENGKAKTIPITIKRQTSTEALNVWTYNFNGVTIDNQKKYIKLSGNVWEDTRGGKSNEYTYKDDDNGLENKEDTISNLDVKIKGIKVTLKDKEGNVVINDKTENEYTTVTDENGHYTFDDVLIENLEDYYVEFEYDGQIYTTVRDYEELGENTENIEDKSKAREINRADLDNKYESLSGTNEANQSSVENSTNSFNVTYNLKEASESQNIASAKNKNMTVFESQLVGLTRDVNEFRDEDNNEYENYNINKLTSNTKETEYGVLGSTTLTDIYQNGKEELTDINCGLREREKPNLSISVDLERVTATLNGYTHDYNYGIYTIDNNTSEEDEAQFKLDVYNGDKKYTRKVYKSDIKNKCDIYLTYKITVKNRSNSLSAKVYKVANYYDARYTIDGIGTTIECNDNELKIDETNNETENGYIKTYLEYTNDAPLLTYNNTTEIFVKYKLTNEAVLSIMDKHPTFYNVVEIQQYATFYGENTFSHEDNKDKIYSGIDRNSVPGNVGNITMSEEANEFNPIPSWKTFEDDTMFAPAITMELTTNERTITGNVFEDMKVNGSLGDGVYDKDDRVVEGVKVEIVEFNEDEKERKPIHVNQDGVYVDDESAEILGTTSDENGLYTISGILPGKYMLKYTYGNNAIYKDGIKVEESLNADNYKSTIITSEVIKNELAKNPQVPSMWYKEIDAPYSCAIDDDTSYNRSINPNDPENVENIENNENYLTINKKIQSEEENGKPKTAYSAGMNVRFELVDDGNGTADIAGASDVNDPKNMYTTSRTVIKTNPDGSQQVETVLTYYNNNICFGIIERPKRDYEITKKITEAKLSTAEQPGLNVDETNLNNYPFTRADTKKMEVDTNILMGATVDIKYEVVAKNNSEVDYNTKEYYNYGIPSGTECSSIVFSKIIDYLDNDLVYGAPTTETSNGNNIEIGLVTGNTINLKNDETLNMEDYLYDNVIERANKHNNILILENADPVARESDTRWVYTASQLVAPQDELYYVSDVECIEVKVLGPLTRKNILGNFIPDLAVTIPDNIETSGVEIENLADTSEIVQVLYGGETDYYSAPLSITPPTGKNKNMIIYIISGISLVILAAGIWIIKKKVL